MQNRPGEIYNRARARQLRDFSGILLGDITPTDIDGLIEYHNKAYIFIELKLKDADFPKGQRLALERLTDDLKKPAICIVAIHEVSNPEDDIDVANTTVTEYRYLRKWRKPHQESTTKEFVGKFITWVDSIPLQ